MPSTEHGQISVATPPKKNGSPASSHHHPPTVPELGINAEWAPPLPLLEFWLASSHAGHQRSPDFMSATDTSRPGVSTSQTLPIIKFFHSTSTALPRVLWSFSGQGFYRCHLKGWVCSHICQLFDQLWRCAVSLMKTESSSDIWEWA